MSRQPRLRLVVSNELGAARHSDPVTSQLAAGSINATRLEWIVFAYLFETGRDLSAFEIALGLNRDRSWVSPRLPQLKRKGYVVKTGKRLCINAAGNYTPQETWLALEPAARDFIRQ